MEFNSLSGVKKEFRDKLMSLGSRYHIHHPFHRMMHEGKLNRHQVQGWVANRYYYQIKIPIKDAQLLANCPDESVRRIWLQRIIDHDGTGTENGGIEAWLRLGEACDLDRATLQSMRMVLPGVKFAVDSYVNFVRDAPWQEGVCSSLTELFAPEIHQQRLTDWPEKYPWIDPEGLSYFRNRLGQARRDVEHGVNIVLEHFVTPAAQSRALEILQFKLEILWSMLDSMYLAYVLDMPPFFNTNGDSWAEK